MKHRSILLHGLVGVLVGVSLLLRIFSWVAGWIGPGALGLKIVGYQVSWWWVVGPLIVAITAWALRWCLLAIVLSMSDRCI
jgi:hypothetical protein